MKVLIVEDEPMAQANLCRTLLKCYSDIEVVGMTSSVNETVSWLRTPGNDPDVIFMDVELSDGDCFEVFREVDVNAKVVMTTAYDNYAVRAFEVNSIDYLLKPIEKDALDRAVERCRRVSSNTDVGALLRTISGPSSGDYKHRFMVRLNDKILPVPVSGIAYFISEDKVTWMYTDEGAKYILDQSLDILSSQLDPAEFFRVSRSCIIASSAVKSIVKLQGGRLKINPRPDTSSEILVSRSRSDDFLTWMESR